MELDDVWVDCDQLAVDFGNEYLLDEFIKQQRGKNISDLHLDLLIKA